MVIQEFVQNFKEAKVVNSKVTPDAVSNYLKKELEIKTYIPFKKKRVIVENVVAQNIEWVDGFKKTDPMNEYVGFVMSMILAHTNLSCSDDPVADYDLLAESGLLPQIIAEFQESYSECDVLLKLARTYELEDNNVNAIVARFLDDILNRLDDVGEILKDRLGNFDIKDILGDKFNENDLANLKGFLDKYNK